MVVSFYKIFDYSKLNTVANCKLNVPKIMISDFDRVANIVEKEKSAVFQHYLQFPLFFIKVAKSCYAETLIKNYRWCVYQMHHLNPFPNKPWFLRVYSASHLKTL